MSAILQNPRAFPLAVILVCVGALASALASQHWGGLQPCVLCIYQRYAYGVALGIGILAFAAAPWRAGQRLWAYLAGLAFLGGGAIAAFHTGVERKWWQGTAECHAPEFDPTMTAADLREMLLNQTFVPCDEIPWSLFGLSMANYNTLGSLVLAAACVWAANRMSGPQRNDP